MHARWLGRDIGGFVPSDCHVDGVVEMMLDATQNYAVPFTVDLLFAWHAVMWPTGRSGMTAITVGAWRIDENRPMQMVSGPIGCERANYQAPPALVLDRGMVTTRRITSGDELK